MGCADRSPKHETAAGRTIWSRDQGQIKARICDQQLYIRCAWDGPAGPYGPSSAVSPTHTTCATQADFGRKKCCRRFRTSRRSIHHRGDYWASFEPVLRVLSAPVARCCLNAVTSNHSVAILLQRDPELRPASPVVEPVV